MTTMSPFADINDELSRYFTALGYTVTWDFNRARTEHWYEILDKKTSRLLCQIDFGVSLAVFLQDLPSFAEGKSGTSNQGNYTVCGSVEDFKAIYKRVQDAH